MKHSEGSEVARLRAQIDAEYEAGQAALHSMALGTARHDFINAKTENMGRLTSELVKIVGTNEAMGIIAQIGETK